MALSSDKIQAIRKWFMNSVESKQQQSDHDTLVNSPQRTLVIPIDQVLVCAENLEPDGLVDLSNSDYGEHHLFLDLIRKHFGMERNKDICNCEYEGVHQFLDIMSEYYKAIVILDTTRPVQAKGDPPKQQEYDDFFIDNYIYISLELNNGDIDTIYEFSDSEDDEVFMFNDMISLAAFVSGTDDEDVVLLDFKGRIFQERYVDNLICLPIFKCAKHRVSFDSTNTMDDMDLMGLFIDILVFLSYTPDLNQEILAIQSQLDCIFI